MLSFNGFAEQVITLKGESDIAEGTPVTIDTNGNVIKAEAGADFIGVLRKSRTGICSVQTHGYVQLNYSGTTVPNYGVCKIASAGDGSVKAGASGNLAYKVVYLDKENNKIGFIL